MNVKCKCHIKNEGDTQVEYDAIEKCSKCNKALSPERLYCIAIKRENKYYLHVADYCASCKSVIITEYKMNEIKNTYGELQKLEMNNKNYTAPIYYEKEEFDEKIEKMSPQFVKIYNQALQAEVNELDELAGLGYRKSIEFLIKDYAIHENAEKEEEIKNTWMKSCIDKYIDNPKIKTLAEKSDWIGNDEAHYIRKQKDRDITDMKKFIKAMVYFIGMNLIVEDADSMESKK